MQHTRLIAGTTAPPRILVVDDDETICDILARSLTPLGFAVDVALAAHTALGSMEMHAADVALVDIRMPEHDGVWLIERLQKKYPGTAIIIVTGIRDLDPRLTLRPGVVGYLTKPFRTDKVRDMVRQAIDMVRSLPPGAPLRALPGAVSEAEIADLHDIDHDKRS